MSEQQFFCIRGYMKSGTNWIAQILNCHPDIHCIGEFHWERLFQAHEDNVARIAPQRQSMLRNVVEPELQTLVCRSLKKLSGRNTKWIGDRTPASIAPIVIAGAPHFVMVRDVRDVMVSRMFHLYNRPQITTIFECQPQMAQRLLKFQQDPWYFHHHPEELLDCEEIVRQSAREWRQFLESDRQTMAAHPELPVKVVRYEELHSDFDCQLESLFAFLDLEPAREIPESLRPGHSIESPTSFNRKGIVGDWKHYVSDHVLHWIDSELGKTSSPGGYTS